MKFNDPTAKSRKKPEKTGELELKLMLLLCALMIILAVLGYYLQYTPAHTDPALHRLPALPGR